MLRTAAPEDVESALADGSVVEVEWDGAAAVALTELAEAEELLADGLLALVDENRVAVVVGDDAVARRSALDGALHGVPAHVLDDAHRLGLEDVLAAVEDLPEQSVLALCLDPALPLADVPGAVALDLARSGRCPVLRAAATPPRSRLEQARRDVAEGRWPATAADDRSLVEVRVGSPDEAVKRVAQLVGTSIPRAFQVGPDDVLVLLAPGSVDAAAVRAALGPGATRVLPLDPAAADHGAEAAVVVLGPDARPGLRSLVYAGLRSGSRHVSLVHGNDPAALGASLAAAADRPRRTRLAGLLTG